MDIQARIDQIVKELLPNARQWVAVHTNSDSLTRRQATEAVIYLEGELAALRAQLHTVERSNRPVA